MTDTRQQAIDVVRAARNVPFAGKKDERIVDALATAGLLVTPEQRRHEEDKLRDLGLRNQLLARDRAKVTRAARRLVNACLVDDDLAAEYVDALEALRALVGPTEVEL